MLRLLFISTFLLLFTACIKNNIIVDVGKSVEKALTKESISKIAIPVREHGYSNFKTQLLTTQKELDNFLKEVKTQEGWNKKENFIETLTLKEVDFSTYNILLYRITESSSSTVLAVEAPEGTVKKIIIKSFFKN